MSSMDFPFGLPPRIAFGRQPPWTYVPSRLVGQQLVLTALDVSKILLNPRAQNNGTSVQCGNRRVLMRARNLKPAPVC